MAPIRVRFSPGFLPGTGFPGEHVFRGFSGAPVVIRTTLEQPHFTFADALWSRISRRACISRTFRGSSGNHARSVSLNLPRKWRSGEQLLPSSRTTLEQIALRENTAQERLMHTRTDAILKKFNVKTTFKLNINKIRDTSDLFNQTISRPPQSRETIPLSAHCIFRKEIGKVYNDRKKREFEFEACAKGE
jgi:hypothetical protein